MCYPGQWSGNCATRPIECKVSVSTDTCYNLLNGTRRFRTVLTRSDGRLDPCVRDPSLLPSLALTDRQTPDRWFPVSPSTSSFARKCCPLRAVSVPPSGGGVWLNSRACVDHQRHLVARGALFDYRGELADHLPQTCPPASRSSNRHEVSEKESPGGLGSLLRFKPFQTVLVLYSCEHPRFGTEDC